MRVSLGLIMAIVSIILLSDMIGIIPDRTTAVIDGRKKIAETLAVQYSLASRRNDYDSIESSMRMLVERNDEVLSAAMRNADGKIVAVAGDHDRNWDATLGERSTPTQIQVPIYNNAKLQQKWGSVELAYSPTSRIHIFGISIAPLVLMTIFVAITGFLVFLLLIKRIFNDIDPSSVVPDRVRKALDTLTEGVVLIDKKSRILFANEVFTDAIGKSESQIIGRKADDLGWEGAHSELPWAKTMNSGVSAVGEKIVLALTDNQHTQFVVNSSPVLDDAGKQQGVMVTFDDVTELEARNSELREMVSKLKKSSEKINSQNEELQILATRDPLTNCLNRRSLFDMFEERCLIAIRDKTEFSCLMLDIDYFKRVNDNYGHAAGDNVLKVVSAAIDAMLRSNDEVFRYGGEEFCILLPDTDIESSARLAERVRANIEAHVIDDVVEGHDISVTCSLGIASVKSGAKDLMSLIEIADAALYESKHNGRNRVSIWSAGSAMQGQSAEAANRNGVEISGTGTETHLSTVEHQGIDEVTGLPDRAHFRREIDRVIEHADLDEKYTAVLILDLDLFQRINNVFGYGIGDSVLDAVATRLSSTVRATDSAFRLGDKTPGHVVYGLGGDEFGVLLTGLESRDDVPVVVDRLISSLTAPLDIDDQKIFLTCSVGASLFPGDGVNSNTLITNAGIALQHAKCNNKETLRFFSNDLVSVARNDYETEKALRYALENNEFELYFQPQLDVQSLRIEAMEALIRWHHPKRGMIMPGEFIPLAEKTGLIIEIGNWVIKAACQQIRTWKDGGYSLPVAINLSPLQFRHKDLVEQINTAVSSARINPKDLQLEITENMIMDDIDNSMEIMQALSRLGYMISIDDFGTGYSSLEYLKRFPVANLKIDRAFIMNVDTDPNDAAIVRAAIAMAHDMGLKVVAEGVETEEQLLFLRNLRCDKIQGFLLGVPMPASEAISLVDEKQLSGQTDLSTS